MGACSPETLRDTPAALHIVKSLEHFSDVPAVKFCLDVMMPYVWICSSYFQKNCGKVGLI